MRFHLLLPVLKRLVAKNVKREKTIVIVVVAKQKKKKIKTSVKSVKKAFSNKAKQMTITKATKTIAQAMMTKTTWKEQTETSGISELWTVKTQEKKKTPKINRNQSLINPRKLIINLRKYK